MAYQTCLLMNFCAFDVSIFSIIDGSRILITLVMSKKLSIKEQTGSNKPLQALYVISKSS